MAGNIKLIGAVGIKVRPDTDDFKRELREDLRNLPDTKLKIEVDADLTAARRGIKREREIQEANEITLNVGFDYDNIKRNVGKVDSMLKSLRDSKNPYTFTPDMEGLKQAKRDLAKMAKDANVEFKFSRDEAGYRSILQKIDHIRRQKMVSEWKFKTDAASLKAAERKAKEALAKIDARKTVEISYGNNYDGINKAIGDIDQRLEALRELKLKTKLDKKSLEEARQKLADKLANADVTIKYNEDKAGYQSVLKKIKEIQRQKLEKTISFKTDDATLEAMAADIEEKLAGLEERAKITLKVNNDTNDLLKAVAQIDAALHDLGKIDIDVELDETQLRAKRAELEEALTKSKLKIEIDTTSVDALSKKRAEVQGMLDALKPKLTMEVANDPESLRRALYEIDHHKREAEKNKIKLEVESTGLGLMAARLKVATRPRTVPFYIRINEKSLLVAEGILKSLSGFNTLTALGRQFESIFTNFDQYALKAGALATGLGSVADTLLHIGTSAFSVGQGISNVVGLLAAAPALITTMAAGIFVYTAAFDNFSNAFSEDAKKRAIAMKELPANARAAVDSLRGLYKEIARPVQDAFWEKMGTSLQDAIHHLIPQVKDGLTGMAKGAGKMTAGILDSFTEIAQNGQLKTMFQNITTFFDKTGQAAKPFFDGFNQFGIRGSQFLPKFGDWLLTMSKRFDDWATRSANNGDINRWIEEGVQSLKDMWNVGGSVIRMFQGITSAALAAGGSTLTEFSDNLSHIADVINGEPFQSRAADIFRGAREGAGLLNVGFMDLTTSLGESSKWLGTVLTQLGGLGGKFLSNVAVTIDSQPLKDGIDKTLGGLDRMLQGLRPSFESLGDIIGGLGTIAGSVFGGMAPLINTVTGLIGGLVQSLSGNLAQAAEALLSGMNGRITALATPIAILGGLLNGLLGFFNGLGEGAQSVVIAMGIFLLMRGQLSAMLTAIGSSKPFTKMRDNWRMAESAAGRFGTSQERQFRLTTALWENSVAKVKDIGGGFRDLTDRVRGTQGGMQRFGVVGAAAMRGIKSAATGLMNFMGGPLGLAIAAVSVVASVIGEESAKAKARVDDLVGAMDGQTGINAATEKVIASQLTAKGSFAWWETNSVADNAKEIGINIRDIQLAAEGVPDSVKAVQDSLRTAFDKRNGLEQAADWSKTFAGLFGPARGVMEVFGGAFGSTASKTAEGLQKIKSDLEAARVQTEQTAAALGVPVNTATGIISAIETLSDKASTADEKLRAVEDVLARLNKKETGDDAVQRANDTARDFVTNMKAIVDAGKAEGLKFGSLVDAAGNIDTVSKAGSDLRTEVQNMAKDGRDAALKLALAQENPKAAIQTLQDKWAATRAKIGEQLKLAGIPPEEVEAVLQQLDFPPGVVEVLLSGKSKEQMLEDIGLLRDDMNGQLGPVVGKVEADPTPFMDTIRGAEQRGVDFGAAPATKTLDGNKGPFDLVVGAAGLLGLAFQSNTFAPALGANKLPFDLILSLVTGKGLSLNGTTYQPKIDGDKAGFDSDAGSVTRQGNDLNKSTYTTTIDAGGNALNVAKGIADTIGGFAGKTFSLGIDIVKMFSGQANGAIYGAGMKPMPGFEPKWFANGGFNFTPNVKMFANGGFENHTAQITRPGGPVRIWSEPETQGEAYIPLAASKRQRSTQILAQVAAQFGLTLGSAQQFANGGIVTRDRTGGGVAVHIGQYTQNTNDTTEDVARAIMRRVKTEGVYAPMEGF